MTIKKGKASASDGNPLGGPVTEQGKQIVSYNSTRHGLRSKRLLQWEDRNEFIELRQSVSDYLCPVDATEAEVVDGFVIDMWRLRRVMNAEVLHFAKVAHQVMAERARADLRGSYDDGRPLRYGNDSTLPLSPEGLRIDQEASLRGVEGTCLNNINAYQTNIQRAAYRSLEILEKMRKLKGGGGKE